ncbi:hypothetical protein OG985_41000 [Streptomyces sp. NBC_00289]|uniref:hypothetical protein n=1 Tax=Streptomyces sp. NBC_00289 TaxID=2975703 RepID=UPI00324C57E3
MSNHRRGRLVCSTRALLTGLGGVRRAGMRQWARAVLLASAALTPGVAAVRQGRRARARVVTRHRRAASGMRSPLPVPEPCCPFWKNSDGVVHGPDCVGAGSLAAEVDQGWRELHGACCLHGWESRGSEHDSLCAERTVA